MNEHEMTMRSTRPAAAAAASDENLPTQATSQELLAQAHAFGRAAREANRNIHNGADALDELSKRAQRSGQ